MVALDQNDITDFLTATAQDSLTLLHATALFARWVSRLGLPVYTPGKAVTEASRKGFELGLMFPVDHLSHFLYVPDVSSAGSTQMRVIYDRQYTYGFDADIFDADVLVQGSEITYRSEGKSRKGFLVTAKVHYEDGLFRYSDVRGISGKKRGALGFLQRVFFFVPKTLHGISLEGDDLIIDAFVNQRIPDFEVERKFRVRRN